MDRLTKITMGAAHDRNVAANGPIKNASKFASQLLDIIHAKANDYIGNENTTRLFTLHITICNRKQG